jgi:hypothetical protein
MEDGSPVRISAIFERKAGSVETLIPLLVEAWFNSDL